MESENQPPNPSSNPNSSLVVPKHIKEDLFQEVLEKDFPNFSKIKKFSPMAAIGPGENYTSTMLRVLIDVVLKDGTTVSTSYVVKTTLESSIARELLDAFNLFPKEMEIYGSVLPQFEKLYAEAGVEKRFGPQCKIIKETSEHTTIIMEDLRQRQFSNMNRLEGLDMVHAVNVMKKLAELHAASAVYYERVGPFSKLLSEGYFTPENRPTFKNFGSAQDEMFKDALSKWGDCERYIPIWPNPDKLFDWFVAATTPDPNEFNVLNHGDCWLNNIMFQHNKEGEVSETYFVDYQITQWCSPAQDIIYFILTSTNYDLRIKEFDHFVRIYHEHLAKNLRLLKYQKPIPTLKDLHIILLKNSLWGFYTITSALQAILSDPSTDSSAENYISESEKGNQFRQQVIMKPRYVKALKQILPWLENRGMFEF